MHVTVLGVTGSIGHAVAQAFLAAGHTVTALARTPAKVAPAEGLSVVQGDATRAVDLDRALVGADLLFHGVNLPYPDWDPAMVDLTAAVVAAAERAGTPILFPGNVYGLGPVYTAPLREEGPYEPVSKKGALRNRLEALLRDASVQTIVVRAGDYFGRGAEGTWMHELTKSAVAGGALQYPARRDILHAWAYLPDLAETFVRVADRRSELPSHAVFHFEGHVVDGDTFIAAARTVLGDARKVRAFPWLLLQVVRPFVPLIRELFEMRYLWDEPVRLDGSKLRGFLGEVPHTPLTEALAHTLA